MFTSNIGRDEGGTLIFAGQNVRTLAKKYGTPLYLMDEERIRTNCRLYVNAFRKYFGADALPLYASKACSFRQIYRIIADEGLGIDVVSGGELYTALQAGFPADKIYFHGNCKTDAEIREGVNARIGYFVVDNREELQAVSAEAVHQGIVQKILLRLTPGVDPHTYAAVNTGMVDSKFGVAIETGQAESFVKAALTLPGICLQGYHCHVGSQVFEEDVYQRAGDIMLTFMAEMRKKYGTDANILNMGGGYGVRYIETDGKIDIDTRLSEVAAHISTKARELGMTMPVFLMEPGRSIVADAGMTVYTVGSVKRIPGYKNYVAVDGGMTDNPRYALYQARYTVLAEKAPDGTQMTCDLVGRCCESGDILQPDVCLPDTITRGDLVAVCTTGAYNYSMASNYNRVPLPPVIMLLDGQSYVAVKRQTYQDMTQLDE